MICPKCGNEFEGTSCPKCNAPAILVNASDYERRRREWEEREKKKNSEEQKKQKNRDEVRRVAKKIADTDYSQIVSSKAGRAAGFASKNRRVLAMAGAVIAAAIVIIVIAGIMVRSGNNVLYTSDGTSIYKGMDQNSRICSVSDVIFNYDKSRAYAYNIAGSIDKDSIIDTIVSSDGSYYAAVLYSEDESSDSAKAADEAQYIGESNSAAVNGNAVSTGTYMLVCWKKNSEYVTVRSSTDRKALVTMTDDGMLVYTDTHYLNEGAIGSEILGCYYINEQQNITLSSDTEEYMVAADSVIWKNTDGTLYRISYKDTSAARIAQDVKNIYSQQMKGLYVRANGGIQQETAFIYAAQNGEYVYIDLSDKKNPDGLYLFQTQTQTDSIVYISRYGCAYAAGGGKLLCITGISSDNGNGTPERKTETAAELASSDIYYSSDSKILYYVNKSDELIAVKNAGKNSSADNSGETVKQAVTQSGIRIAGYSDGGFWYMSQSELYYCDGSSRQVRLMDDARQGAIIYCVTHKNRIYCLYEDTLSRISLRGARQMSTGNIQNVWTGRVKVR